ncbi:gustatory receptor for sugar taste 64f-like [Tenebrio molitor]|uniref:gustatory receptor for sugar taste 64f-like n=1 Tax=Tenebrio molitor TaxID=7067 RepID=UPI0036249345
MLAFSVEHILVQTKNPRCWKKMREEHYTLCKLCSFLDNKLSYIVLVSYGTNLYFILIQLFGSVRQLKSTLRKVYYFISFGFLITRLVSVSFYGSWINEESKKILPLLFSVPSSVYNAEVERFIDQVIKSNLIITGKNFFKITKGLILQIAGAIVTYELVLMQFNAQLLQSNEDFKDNICKPQWNSTVNNN